MNNWTIEELKAVVDEFRRYEDVRSVDDFVIEASTLETSESDRGEKLRAIFVRCDNQRDREEAVHCSSEDRIRNPK